MSNIHGGCSSLDQWKKDEPEPIHDCFCALVDFFPNVANDDPKTPLYRLDVLRDARINLRHYLLENLGR
jgi:hypothetical protein